LYNDFKSDSGITWAMNPAVRSPTGQCIEEQNCDWEKATVCAFSNASVADRVSFLACMDESNGIMEGRRLLGGGGGGSALDAGKKCAPASTVDPSVLEACYNGADGEALLADAAKVWNKAFPGAASVPHTNIDGKQVNAEYASLKTALCTAGSTAAVCKGIVECTI